jgi:hypothetical protein
VTPIRSFVCRRYSARCRESTSQGDGLTITEGENQDAHRTSTSKAGEETAGRCDQNTCLTDRQIIDLFNWVLLRRMIFRARNATTSPHPQMRKNSTYLKRVSRITALSGSATAGQLQLLCHSIFYFVLYLLIIFRDNHDPFIITLCCADINSPESSSHE